MNPVFTKKLEIYDLSALPDEPMDNVTVEKMDSEAGNRAQWMVVR